MRFRRTHPFERALRRGDPLPPEITHLIGRVARSAAKDAVQEVMEDQGLVFYTDPDQHPREEDPEPFITGRHLDRCSVHKFDSDGVIANGLVNGYGCSRWKDHEGQHLFEIPAVTSILDVPHAHSDSQ